MSIRRVVRWGRLAWTGKRAGVPLRRGELVGHRPLMTIDGTATIGRWCRIWGRQFPSAITVRHGGYLTIGDDVFINQGTDILCAERVAIGDHCRIADLVGIRDTDSHPIGPDLAVATSPVTIGRNVWIGRGAIILRGVTIGNHAVVAAGSVVSSDVPACSVVAGVPAKVIRTFAVTDDSWIRP